MATISEHDISDDNQAPAVAEHFEGQIDRAAGAPCVSHPYCPPSRQILLALCNNRICPFMPPAQCQKKGEYSTNWSQVPSFSRLMYFDNSKCVCQRGIFLPAGTAPAIACFS